MTCSILSFTSNAVYLQRWQHGVLGRFAGVHASCGSSQCVGLYVPYNEAHTAHNKLHRLLSWWLGIWSHQYQLTSDPSSVPVYL